MLLMKHRIVNNIPKEQTGAGEPAALFVRRGLWPCLRPAQRFAGNPP